MRVAYHTYKRGNAWRLACLVLGHDWFMQSYRKDGEWVGWSAMRCLRCQRIRHYTFSKAGEAA